MKDGIVQNRHSPDTSSTSSTPSVPTVQQAQPSNARITDVPIGTLLGVILADHPPEALCVVQFVACDGRATSRAVALALAAASASQFGRTLALETDAAAATGMPCTWAARLPCPTEVAMRQTTPDAAIPGLSHARIEPGCGQVVLTMLREWSDAPRRPFAMVVLDSAAPAESAQALTLARSCTATILVAHAGTSRLAILRDSQRRLLAAGAHLRGFVFVREAARPPRARITPW